MKKNDVASNLAAGTNGVFVAGFDHLTILIEEASAGPWEVREADGLAAVLTAAGWLEDQSADQEVKNARFIAAFNPVMARQLVVLARRGLFLDQQHGSYELTVFEAWLGAMEKDEVLTRLERDQMRDAWMARAGASYQACGDEKAAFVAWFAADELKDGCRGTSPVEREQMLCAWLARAAVARREKLAQALPQEELATSGHEAV